MNMGVLGGFFYMNAWGNRPCNQQGNGSKAALCSRKPSKVPVGNSNLGLIFFKAYLCIYAYMFQYNEASRMYLAGLLLGD